MRKQKREDGDYYILHNEAEPVRLEYLNEWKNRRRVSTLLLLFRPCSADWKEVIWQCPKIGIVHVVLRKGEKNFYRRRKKKPPGAQTSSGR